MISIASDIHAPLAPDLSAPADSLRQAFRRHAYILPSFYIGLTVCAWFTTWGDGRLFDAEHLSGFYDAQARAILHGRMDVPPDAIEFEAFVRDGKSYGYFGVGPALLRMPLVVLFPNMDGRWSRSFMLIACAINLLCAYRLLLRIGGCAAPQDRAKKAFYSLFILCAGIGSTNVFIASRAYVYHEAIIWGGAFALLFTDCLLSYLAAPRLRVLLAAGVFAFLSFHSRATVGAGALLALCVLTISLLWRLFEMNPLFHMLAQPRSRRDTESTEGTEKSNSIRMNENWFFGFLFSVISVSLRPLRPLRGIALNSHEEHFLGWVYSPTIVASRGGGKTVAEYTHPTMRDMNSGGPLGHALVACLMIAFTLATYFGVNYARFHTFDGVPLQYYARYFGKPDHLQATSGKQFHLENLPTGFASYFGFGGVRVDWQFPWLYMAKAPYILGTPAIDVVEAYSSVPMSMPALVLLTLAGGWPIMKGRSVALRRLRLPAVSLLLGGSVVLLTVGITERYLHDFYPFLIVVGAAGVGRLVAGRNIVKVAAGFVVLTIISIAFNCSFALVFQREIVWGMPEEKRTELVHVRQAFDRLLHRTPTAAARK